jgi:hypothetical protein
MVASVPPPPRDKSIFQNNLGSIEFFYLASAACIIASKRWRRHVASAQVRPGPAAASSSAARHSRLIEGLPVSGDLTPSIPRQSPLSMRWIRSSPCAFIGPRRHIGVGYTEAAVIHGLFALVTRHVIAMQFAALGAPGI